MAVQALLPLIGSLLGGMSGGGGSGKGGSSKSGGYNAPPPGQTGPPTQGQAIAGNIGDRLGRAQVSGGGSSKGGEASGNVGSDLLKTGGPVAGVLNQMGSSMAQNKLRKSSEYFMNPNVPQIGFQGPGQGGGGLGGAMLARILGLGA